MKAVTSASTSDRLPPRFQFIGGKGGVGKTTCAAAFALAEASAGARVLVASTDPAPSLGDAFKVPLGPAPRRIAIPRATLFAVEIDAPPVLKRWISDRRSVLEKIALQGTWLDREDVTRLLRLSLPGIDEVAALLEISRLAATGRYDTIVVDTAPTGHTLRMLAMPETLFAVARVFDHMRQKHRVMVEALRGGWTPEAEDALIDDVAGEAKALAGMLRDAKRTRLSWVTLPEPMAIAETADALSALAARGMFAAEVIVNRVTPVPPSRCRHCEARRGFEARALRSLPADVRVVQVQARDVEPRGLRALRAIGRELQEPAPSPPASATSSVWTAVPRGRRFDASSLAPDGTRLLLFGGKGGVGKTTCAAAAAIAVAARQPDRRVLLISTDPAHSLGDVLGVTLSDDAVRVKGAPPNLRVREMDAARVFDDVRRKYSAAIDALFARVGAGGSFDIGHDRSVMHALIDLAPPGLDELAAIIEITDVMAGEAPKWDLAVIDTAPTGHALRLLEMPSLIHEWTKTLMSILLKYQAVTGLGGLGPLLLKLSRGLGTLRALLTDASRTRFVVVTRAAALPRVEALRLVSRLEELGIQVPALIVNATGRGTCVRCRKADAAERRELAALRRAISSGGGRRALLVTGARVPPPATPARLREWQRSAWAT